MSESIIAILVVALAWSAFFTVYFYFDSKMYRKAYRDAWNGWGRSIKLTEDLFAYNQTLREYIFKQNTKITVHDKATPVIKRLQNKLGRMR